MKNTTLSLLFLSFFTVAFTRNYSNEIDPVCFEIKQINNTLVVYVEASSENDNAQIKAFILKMESYSNKIESIKYNYTTHEFTIKYTSLISKETILDMLRKEFGQYKVSN